MDNKLEPYVDTNEYACRGHRNYNGECIVLENYEIAELAGNSIRSSYNNDRCRNITHPC